MDKRSRRAGLEDESHEILDGAEPADDASSKGKRFDLSAMLKKNPQAARLGAGVGVLLLLVVLLWYFMFSGSEKKRPRRAGPPPGSGAQRAAIDLDDGMDVADDPEAEPDDAASDPDETDPDDAPPEAPPEDEPEEPPLPEDVAQWEPEHFERARREGHPSLLDAVGHLGRDAADREAAAAVLVSLLQPLPPEETEEAEPETGPRGVRRPVHPGAGRATAAGKLAEAVVEALAANATPTALEALEQVIAGELEIEEADESRLVETALEALAEHPAPGNEELLFRVLTASDDFREPSGTGAAVSPTRSGSRTTGQPLSAEWLRARTLALVEKTASAGFRARLATFLAQPTTPLAWRAELGEFLLDPTAANLGAQFVMYQNARLEDEVRAEIEAHFAARSAQAVVAVLEVPEEAVSGAGRGTGRGIGVGRGRGAMPAEEQDPELPFRLARQLWGERSTGTFTQRLAEIDRRVERGPLLALCATMPVESVRSELLQTLRAHHADGPDALEKAGIPGTMVPDPGFLLVVKSLDREEPKALTASRTVGRGQTSTTRGADGAAQDWMKYSETLVLSWCERLDAAALVQDEKARLAGKNPATLRRLEDLPVELHEGADVRAAFHLVLPSGLPAEKLAGAQVGPIRVQYVR
ncbi:MAG: hypothetical protein ACOCWL_01880, partial [Thermoguttaceae bacterium]